MKALSIGACASCEGATRAIVPKPPLAAPTAAHPELGPMKKTSPRDHALPTMQIRYRSSFFNLLRFQIAHQFCSVGYQAAIIAMCLFVYHAESSEHGPAQSLAIATVWSALAWVVQDVVTAFILATKRGPADKDEHLIEI